jgi:hypothetical protein
MKIRVRFAAFFCMAAAMSVPVSCVTKPAVREIVFEDQMTLLQARSIQSRTFELTDRIQAMRSVLTTLQDLDFVIDGADSSLGIITATKLQRYQLHITVKVDALDSGRIRVRAQMSAGMVELAQGVYQEFFASLEKNFFLFG